MKKLFTLSLVALFVSIGSTAFAQMGYLSAVHGIPGLEEPVEVEINGMGINVEFSFDFGETFGPAPLEVGDYDVQISYLGNPVPGLGGTVTIEEDVSKTAVAHLDEAGNIAPLSLFVNETSPPRRLFARLQIFHLAAAPPVDASVRKGWRSRWPRFELSGLSNGDQATAIDFALGWYNVGLLANDVEVFNSGPIRLRPGNNFGVYAVGVFPESFTLVYLPLD